MQCSHETRSGSSESGNFSDAISGFCKASSRRRAALRQFLPSVASGAEAHHWLGNNDQADGGVAEHQNGQWEGKKRGLHW